MLLIARNLEIARAHGQPQARELRAIRRGPRMIKVGRSIATWLFAGTIAGLVWERSEPESCPRSLLLAHPEIPKEPANDSAGTAETDDGHGGDLFLVDRSEASNKDCDG